MPDERIDRRSILKGATIAGGLFAASPTAARSGPSGRSGRSPDGSEPGAVFHVGGGTRSIAPPSDLPVDVGGFGTCDGCPTTDVRDGDDLAARVLVVADEDREQAVVVAVIDGQGWFAGYEQRDGVGVLATRRRIGATLSEEFGFDAGQEDIVVQATHSHAAPANIGVWGTNTDYLEFVGDQVHAAVVDAVESLEPAVLEVGVGDIGYVNNVTIGQANSYEGWTKDTQLPVLRARAARTGADRPGTGRTIATYVQVPIHENIIFGPGVPEMSSGYFGAAARWLEAEQGGTAVVGPGTLGDQVSPMQGDNTRLPDGTPRAYRVVDRLGGLVSSTASAALRDGTILQDGTVAASERHIRVPASNPLLFAANCSPAGEAVGLPLDRSCEPPFAYGSAVGTWATALRIGDVVVASEPGEAHSHVSTAIRDAFPEARAVFTAGQAQDQLGYFYAPWAFPATFLYSVNHHYFNVGQSLADQNVGAHAENSTALGLGTGPATMDPRAANYERLQRPAVQVTVFPNEPGVTHDTEGVTLPVGVYTAPARFGVESAGTPTVDFGDGTVREWDDGTYDLHTFPDSGTYEVTASIPEEESWTIHVTVEDEHTVHATGVYPDLGTARGTSAADVEATGKRLLERHAGEPISDSEEVAAVASGSMPTRSTVDEEPVVGDRNVLGD